ncbi:DNA alkylation repair protein [Neorhodopirellula lusitana]|uniref:DNA alkylation repair protein n=1 Tax=Neorhodopirellula lusitana TaxID=445327 RepID=UPI00384FD7D9
MRLRFCLGSFRRCQQGTARAIGFLAAWCPTSGRWLRSFVICRVMNCASCLLRLAERLMNAGHDLMNKAIGWMLREMGKRDQPRLETFLKKHTMTMPRTMLRCSIEKLSKEDRMEWMNA